MKNLLVLNKKTIAKLNESQLTVIKGGVNNGEPVLFPKCEYKSVSIIATRIS